MSKPGKLYRWPLAMLEIESVAMKDLPVNAC